MFDFTKASGLKVEEKPEGGAQIVAVMKDSTEVVLHEAKCVTSARDAAKAASVQRELKFFD
jgi:hypothetical protein